MGYNAEILADSVSEVEDRLTTFELTFPRMVLAEFNTHRMLSRNSASSRAIPVERQLTRVLDDPFIPVHWGINQSGMQAEQELDADEAAQAEATWLESRDHAVLSVVALMGGVKRLKGDSVKERVSTIRERLSDTRTPLDLPVHKQVANRLLEPYMWHTAIVTATDWSNFFALRANPQAQPEIQRIAYMMRDLYGARTPDLLSENEWHLPLIQADEFELSIEALKKMSTGRCARVSYLTHDTGRRDMEKDIRLHDSLLRSGHMSPFEHIARPMTDDERSRERYSGNFRGWHQYRKDIPNEQDYALVDPV